MINCGYLIVYITMYCMYHFIIVYKKKNKTFANSINTIDLQYLTLFPVLQYLLTKKCSYGMDYYMYVAVCNYFVGCIYMRLNVCATVRPYAFQFCHPLQAHTRAMCAMCVWLIATDIYCWSSN